MEKTTRLCTMKRMERVKQRLLVWSQTTRRALQVIDELSLSLPQILALSHHLCNASSGL